MIRELHENGIEVILDVVFNHTAEGNENGPFFSFKGFDNNIYYLLTPEGNYYNFSNGGLFIGIPSSSRPRMLARSNRNPSTR